MVKILLVRQDHLGDVLLMTPLIRALAKGGASVTCACRRAVQPVLFGNPHVAACHAIEDVGGDVDRSPSRFAGWIRRQGFGVYILPFPSSRSLIWAGLLGGARYRLTAGGGIWTRVCGFRQVRTGLPDVPRYYAEAHLDFAAALGYADDGSALDWIVQDDERAWAQGFVREKNPDRRPLIGIHPGSGGNTCNLPPSEYRRLALRLLAETESVVIVTGGAHERRLTEDWDAGSRDPRLVNTTGQLTLRQLAALIGEMDLLVAPSTGPLHIAAALGTRTVSPFCERRYLCAEVWGNPNANALHLTPPRASCEAWAQDHEGFCDFRGAIDANDLFDAVREALPD